MCVAGEVGKLALNLTSNLTPNIVSYMSNKDNNEYRTQVAINNAQMAQNEALRQKQLGIELSRKEQIEGLREANNLLAINSANGLDGASLTNQYAYNDILNSAQVSANQVKKEYELNSSEYFKQANNYLKQANLYQKNYNQSLFNNAINALGKTAKVSQDWYNSSKDIMMEDFYGYF